MIENAFTLVGIRADAPTPPPTKQNKLQGVPLLSILILLVIVCGCLCCSWIMTKDPTYLDLAHYTAPPSKEFLFGTDTLGRDIFSMIWFGGRISLFIGFFSTVISTAIAVVFGSLSGIAPQWLDGLMMRFTEILLSVPNLLLIILLQAIFGEANVLSISLVIGITSWTSIAKIVRTEVKQLRKSEYVIASKCMGGGFFHVLKNHLMPNFISSILFMVVMNIRSAIIAESTLSFMGIGFPIAVITWGSMLSLAEKALLTNAWWIILVPGFFLVTVLVCVTNIGNFLRKSSNRKHSNL